MLDFGGKPARQKGKRAGSEGRMSRKYIAREVLKRLRLGEPLGEELIRKFIRFLPELYRDSNGFDDFAKLRHDVFSAFRYDHADKLIGFDLGVCWGAISEEESVSLDYAQEITSLRVNNYKLRQLVNGLTWCAEHTCGKECPLYDTSEPDHCREMRLKHELD